MSNYEIQFIHDYDVYSMIVEDINLDLMTQKTMVLLFTLVETDSIKMIWKKGGKVLKWMSPPTKRPFSLSTPF